MTFRELVARAERCANALPNGWDEPVVATVLVDKKRVYFNAGNVFAETTPSGTSYFLIIGDEHAPKSIEDSNGSPGGSPVI